MNEQSRLVNRHSVDQLADVRRQIKSLQADEKEIVAEISKAMGDSDSLGGDEYIARQTISTRKGALDANAMKDAGIAVERFRKADITVYQIRLERREAENGVAA